MSEYEAIEDYCDDCGEVIYLDEQSIACEWRDLAVEHECDTDE